MDALVDKELENSKRWLICLYLCGRRCEKSRRESVSGRGQSLDPGRDVKRQTSRLERKLPAPLAGAARQEPTDVACCNICDWQRYTGADVPSRSVAYSRFSALPTQRIRLGKPQQMESSTNRFHALMRLVQC
jgi:hypothetical protein